MAPVATDGDMQRALAEAAVVDSASRRGSAECARRAISVHDLDLSNLHVQSVPTQNQNQSFIGVHSLSWALLQFSHTWALQPVVLFPN